MLGWCFSPKKSKKEIGSQKNFHESKAGFDLNDYWRRINLNLNIFQIVRLAINTFCNSQFPRAYLLIKSNSETYVSTRGDSWCPTNSPKGRGDIICKAGGYSKTFQGIGERCVRRELKKELWCKNHRVQCRPVRRGNDCENPQKYFFNVHSQNWKGNESHLKEKG